MDKLYDYIVTKVTEIFNLAAQKQGLKEAKTNHTNEIFGARVRITGKEAEIAVIKSNSSVLINLGSGAFSFKPDYNPECKTEKEFDAVVPKIEEFLDESFALKLIKKI